MITLCWGAKGGSGVTTVAAALALAQRRPTLLVDLAGDAALALGIADDGAPMLDDWFATESPPDRVVRLARRVTTHLEVVPTRRPVPTDSTRWSPLTAAMRSHAGDVVIDAGSGGPPPLLHATVDRSLLVIRPCYLALMRAQRLGVRPHGIVLVDEPGRALGPDDVAAAIGAPVVATMLTDPKIARAIDSGLSVSRLPATCWRELRAAS